jgi:hypothetical protein
MQTSATNVLAAGARLEDAKAAFRASLDGYKAWLARDSDCGSP